jgi:hypothetical protein
MFVNIEFECKDITLKKSTDNYHGSFQEVIPSDFFKFRVRI